MRKSYLKIVWDNLANFCNIVTLTLIILLISIGAWDYAVSSFILFINIAIGMFQEIKAKRAVSKLTLVVRSVYKVIRDGVTLELPTDELKIGDLILINAGQTMPVDGRISEGFVELDESILTGESRAVKKGVGREVLAGSIVKAGGASVVAKLVGKDCYIEKTTGIAKQIHKPKSNIFKTLDRVIKIISIGLVPVAALLFASKMIATEGVGLTSTLIEVSSSILGMIPIGMFLITSTALAASVIKLSKKNALLKDLYSVEMLASVDTLLLDKTGTMTTGELEVAGMHEFKKERDLGGILTAVLNSGKSNNTTAKALLAYVGETDVLDVSDSIPFSSDRKYSGAVIGGRKFVLGAPDFIAPSNADVIKIAKNNSEKCQRTILLAEVFESIESLFDASPIACYALEDKLRNGIWETMTWFRENGVDIRVVSGDECNTVAETTSKTGLFGSEKCVNCNLPEVADKLSEITEHTVIFGRTSPEQKAMIVKTLQENGRVVGMVGDGVNDILALKQADCSISFASASESARDVSRIVMMDSDFTNLPEIVKEGRRAICNVQKVSSLFVMKNIFVMFMTFLFSILIFANPEFSYPFVSKKLMLMEFFVLGLPVFVLSLGKNSETPTGTIGQKILRIGLPSALSLIIGVGIALIYGYTRRFLPQYTASLAAIVLTLSAFICFLIVARPHNKLTLVALAVSFIASILVLLADHFRIVEFVDIDLPIGFDILLVAGCALVSLGTGILFRWLMKKLRTKNDSQVL